MKYRFLRKKSTLAIIGFAFAISLYGEVPKNAPGQQPIHGMKLLKASESLQSISLKTAFTLALLHHSQLKLSRNLLERRRIETVLRVSALLPKVRLISSFTRNIPEIKSNPFKGESQASLYRNVATLLRKSGDISAAAQMDGQADLLLRRNVDNEIIINPKHVLEGKLSVEIPLFNGLGIGYILASNETYLLQEAKVQEEEANTIFATAKAYYNVMHLKNVFLLREQAKAIAKERYSKAEIEKNRGLIVLKDYLEAQANFLEKEAELDGALLEYRSGIANLGIMLGLEEEFEIEKPDSMIFEAINLDTEKLIEIAMDTRPDLKAEQHGLKIASFERASHWMQNLPILTLQGDAKYTSNDKGMLKRNLTYDIMLNASISLFDGGMTIAQLRENSLKKQDVLIRLRQLKVDIDAKIRGHKNLLIQLSKSEKAYEMKSLAAKESADVAMARYKRGLISHQDLLDIIDRKFNIDIAYKKLQSDLDEERLALIYETGLLTPQFIK